MVMTEVEEIGEKSAVFVVNFISFNRLLKYYPLITPSLLPNYKEGTLLVTHAPIQLQHTPHLVNGQTDQKE